MSEQSISFQIGLVPKGAYSSIQKYNINDIVYNYNTSGDNNGVYVAKAESTGMDLSDTNYWKLMIDLTGVKDAIVDANGIISSWTDPNGYKVTIEQAIADAQNVISEWGSTTSGKKKEITDAINNAITQTESARTAAADAVTATTNANNATTNANAAAAVALKATKDMGDIADADHETAQKDNKTAQDDHSTATSDHTIASNDHSQAVSDHNNYTADRQTFATDEAARQSTFETNEANRNTTFQSAESTRQSTFETNEAARDKKVDDKVADITNLQTEVAKHTDEIGDLKDLETEAHGSLVEAINEVYGYAFEEDGHVYGVRHYYNQASPVLTRFQTSTSHDLHQLLPVQSLMRRCLLLDDGSVNYYLDHEDSTKKENGESAVLDGTDGMVMVEIPAHYRKHTLVENTDDASLSYYETAISLLPFSGAFKVNKCYISAYEASMDRTANKLSSVVNTTEQYRGGNNNYAWDGTYRDLRGKPASVISLTNFRTYARNRGALWNCQERDIYNTLYWLYTIEYANLNCQLAFNSNRDGSGYHQGGLGAGVSEINYTKWNSLYSCYPVVPCGVTNSLGNASGVVAYDIPDDADGILYTPNIPSYRGVENPFGHIWKWMDGFLAIGNGTTQEYYICHDRTQYASAKNNYYVSKGQSAGANGYIKEFVRNDEGDILCNVIGGGSTTYGCDYHYEAFANGTTYGVFSGGCASDGAPDGFGSLSSDNAPAATGANLGSRLCWSSHQSLIEKE